MVAAARLLLLLGLVCPLALSACAAQCHDQDGDGFGKGCAQGPDCDDHDPLLAKDCSAAGRKCAAQPFGKGCPCLAGASRQCYAGDEATIGVGACRAGRQRCATIVWGSCQGEVTPAYEHCDGQDNDCDGVVDEGVLSPCGGCDASCVGGVWGPPAAPFEASGDLALTPGGLLTLALHPIESSTVWVPNTGEGTLSKVDAQSARELARYRVAGDAPERIAVDHNGDAWVLSPSLDGQSMLTKVAGGADRCLDTDGDGLQTSQGPSDVLALGSDECVLMSVPVGGGAELARSLAVDGARAPDAPLGGNVWVGLQAAQRLVELDGQSASVIQEVPTPGLAPFDATFDPWGALWIIDRQGLLARVDPGASPPGVEIHQAPLRCYLLDALASDAQGMLTLSGFSCEDVITYDPERDSWKEVPTGGVLDTRGVAVLGEQSWVVHTAGRLSRVRRDPLAITDTFGLDADGLSPIESIAIGADSFGQLWVVSSMGAPDGGGLLTRFDPLAQSVSAQVTLGRLPRPQGDITGARRLGELAEEGSIQHVFDGCAVPGTSSSATRWQRLRVGWDAGVGASIVVAARHAPSRDALADASFVDLGTLPQDVPPFALDFAPGGVVEVRLTLRAGGSLGAPRVSRVGIEWSCPGPQ